ncbi:MAG TPA: Uma2 family endonuclease [Thermomicrobiales bacterium]|jgi:Uma2 family endonuclease
MATQQQPKYWTYEDLFDLPDDKRYEIIEGVLYEMPAPNAAHEIITMNLVQFVFSLVVWPLGGKILTAPLDLFLRRGNPVQPDLLVLLPDQLGMISGRGIEGAPALLVEILSPGNSRHDLVTKRALYADAGVQEYWIVSPEAMIIEVLTLDGAVYRTHARIAGDEPISSALFPTIATLTSAIFER